MGVQTQPLLLNKIATGASKKVLLNGQPFSIEAFGATSASTGAATVLIEGSNVAVPNEADHNGHWVTLATITLTLGTTITCDGGGSLLPYVWGRARVSAISGTNAYVTADICLRD